MGKYNPYDFVKQNAEFQMYEEALKKGYDEGYNSGYEEGSNSSNEYLHRELEQANKELKFLRNRFEDLDIKLENIDNKNMFNTLFIKHFPDAEKTFHKVYLDNMGGLF